MQRLTDIIAPSFYELYHDVKAGRHTHYWLKGGRGEQFIAEAEHLRDTKPEMYAHEYMGEVTGTGGTVFPNVKLKHLSVGDTKTFDKIRLGIDFGYAADPFVYIVCHYDSTRRRLYIFDEIYRQGLSNARAAELIKAKGDYLQTVICDSAEPKSIAELRTYGLRVKGAKKGPDSVDYGIKFLQGLEEIVVDSARCPNAAEEFLNYELEPDGSDGFKDGYPDKNNHAIDAVRYAMEDDMSMRKARVLERREWDI